MTGHCKTTGNWTPPKSACWYITSLWHAIQRAQFNGPWGVNYTSLLSSCLEINATAS